MSATSKPTQQGINASDCAAQVAELERQLREIKAHATHLEKMSSVGVLASSITHEFNNILTTVINYAKMGLRQEDEAARNKAFEKILAAGQRAAKITTGMLSYARNQPQQTDVHALRQLVDDILVLVEKDLQKHRITLETVFSTSAHANVNPNQIQQVLLNLIINARQAMQTGGTLKIRVDTDPSGPWSTISISDTGCGIAMETLPRIFDAFYSTKKAEASGQGGSGLGLSLCKEIIEAHQGRIRVESRVGEGTTFTLKLPEAHPTGLIRSSEMQRDAG